MLTSTSEHATFRKVETLSSVAAGSPHFDSPVVPVPSLNGIPIANQPAPAIATMSMSTRPSDLSRTLVRVNQTMGGSFPSRTFSRCCAEDLPHARCSRNSNRWGRRYSYRLCYHCRRPGHYAMGCPDRLAGIPPVIPVSYSRYVQENFGGSGWHDQCASPVYFGVGREQPSSSERVNQDPRTCWICEAVGHVRRFCPQRFQSLDNSEPLVSHCGGFGVRLLAGFD